MPPFPPLSCLTCHNYDRPVIIIIKDKRCMCIYFLSHRHPFVSVIALVWIHTVQLQKTCFHLKHVLIPTPRVLSD